MSRAHAGQCHPFRCIADKERDRCNTGWNNSATSSGGIFEHRRMRGEPSPADSASQAKLIEYFGIVVADSPRQHLPLPGTGGNFKALKLAQHLQRAMLIAGLRAWRNVLRQLQGFEI